MSSPDLSWTKSADFEHVYEPAEDSWLLMDSLTAEAKAGPLAQFSGICCEIGCGSGAIITHAAMLLGPNNQYYATDINPHAIELGKRMAHHNGVHVNFVLSSFLDELMPALQHRVNVLIFNPPYVPTPPEELQGCGIERSWAGGLRGREVLDVLLPRISDFLAPNGIFYLITVDDNDPAEIAAILSQQGLSSSIVLRTKAKNEKLQVMRFCFSQQ